VPGGGQLQRPRPDHEACRGQAAGRADQGGLVHDVKEHPTAGHAFPNDADVGPRVLRPLFRVAGVGPEPTAAADAWQRIEDFFARHLR